MFPSFHLLSLRSGFEPSTNPMENYENQKEKNWLEETAEAATRGVL